MAIIWIDIWDAQSSSNAKILINRCFNVRKYIATICSANMNPGIPQCKNCWKWDHMIFSCRIQDAKCVKCNGPHKSKNHCEFDSFKCSNCRGNQIAAEEVYRDLWKQGQIYLLYEKRQESTMILWNLRMFSQNVCKNSLVINTILETQFQFDIILIQKSPWLVIHKIPSLLNSKGDDLVGTIHHLN